MFVFDPPQILPVIHRQRSPSSCCTAISDVVLLVIGKASIAGLFFVIPPRQTKGRFESSPIPSDFRQQTWREYLPCFLAPPSLQQLPIRAILWKTTFSQACQRPRKDSHYPIHCNILCHVAFVQGCQWNSHTCHTSLLKARHIPSDNFKGL